MPLVAAENTAGRALLKLLESLPAGIGFEVEIDKGIAMGLGMGGSAASAVAAVVAANAVLDAPVSLDTLYQCAMDGEAAATGSAHGDNVGPMLLGGLVIAPAEGAPVKVPTPSWLHVALVHPPACGVEVLRRLRERGARGTWIVAATAHPAKFDSIVEPLIGRSVPVPPMLVELLARTPRAEPLAPTLEALQRAI